MVEFNAYSFAVWGLVKSFSIFDVSMKNNVCVCVCVCGHMIRNGGLNPLFMLVIFMTRLKKSGFEFQAFCAFIMCEIWLYFCLFFKKFRI